MTQARHYNRPVLTIAPSARHKPHALLVSSLRDHLETARHLAKDPNQDEKLVHQLRTGVKRMRATLRLLRPGLPEAFFRRENRRLREVAYRLSTARERTALSKTLKRFQERSPSEKKRRLFSDARQAFLAQTHASGDEGERFRKKALSILSESLRRLEERSLAAFGWRNFRTAMETSYRKARKAYRHAENDRRDETHHEWRKRIKDLWYQLEALAPSLPAAARSKDRLDSLQDSLGDAQDLAVLENRMAQRARDFGGERTTAAMLGAIRREKGKLRKKSLRRGAEVFAHKARRFVRKLDFPSDATEAV